MNLYKQLSNYFSKNWLSLLSAVSLIISTISPIGVSASDDSSNYNNESLFALSLEQLLNIEIDISSTQSETFLDAPGVLTILNKEDIHRFGGNSLHDLLRLMPAVFPQNGNAAFYSSFGIRGQASNVPAHQILITLNGIPMREALGSTFHSTVLNWFPVDLIEQIEIIRGPGSVLYGSGAFAGVMNIVTKTDTHSDFHLSVSKDSFNTLDTSFNINKSINNELAIRAHFYTKETDGWSMGSFDINHDYAEHHREMSGYSGFVELAYKDFTFNYLKAESEDEVRPQFSVTPFESESNRSFYSLNYNNPFVPNWVIDISFAQSHSTKAIILDTPSTDTSLDIILNHSLGDFLFSYGFQFHQVKSKPKTGGTYIDIDRSILSQIDYDMNDRTNLILGLKLVALENGENKWIARLAAIHDFNPHWSLKALYGKAYRTPTYNEKYRNNLNVYFSNKNLDIETISSYDLQLIYQSKRYYMALSAFHSDTNNTIKLVPTYNQTEQFQYQNTDLIHTQGGELEAKVYKQNFTFDISLSHHSIHEKSGTERTVLIPNTMIKTGITYQPKGKDWDLGLYNIYYSKPKNRKQIMFNYNEEERAYSDLSIQFNYTPQITSLSNFKLSIYARNLLENSPIFAPDETAGSLNTLPKVAPRSVALSAAFGF